MMMELEGTDTANMLKVPGTAERVGHGKSFIEEYATGPIVPAD